MYVYVKQIIVMMHLYVNSIQPSPAVHHYYYFEVLHNFYMAAIMIFPSVPIHSDSKLHYISLNMFSSSLPIITKLYYKQIEKLLVFKYLYGGHLVFFP